MVKDFLSQKGVEYEERDVSRNRAHAQELVNSTGQMGVPVTVFNGEVVVGYDTERLEQLVAGMKRDRKPSLGASIADAAKITAKQGFEIKTGAYIGRIKPGSVAERIGLMPGDIITKLDKVNVSGADDLEKALSGMKKGAYFTIVFTRDSRTLSSEVIL